MTILQVFIDTNLLLQCRKLDQLPWHELFDSEVVSILVPRVVRKEIDHLKGDGKGRRSTRAREVSSLFREVLRSKSQALVLKPESPRVTIDFFRYRALTEDLPANTLLNSSRSDDAIVLEAVTYQRAHLAADILIMSQDVNLLMAAEDAGIKTLEIPEHWLLPPESDEKDKQIAKLQDQLKKVLNEGPVIGLRVLRHGQEIERLPLVLKDFLALEQKEIATVVDGLMADHPMKTSFDAPRVKTATQWALFEQRRYVPPEPSEIEDYKEKYREWQSKLPQLIADMPDQLRAEGNRFNIGLELCNDGAVPASGVILQIEVTNGVIILPTGLKERPSTACVLPSPPSPPEGRYEDPISALGTLMKRQNDALAFLGRGNRTDALGIHNFNVSGREKSEFYENVRTLQRLEFGCMEFRHKLESKAFEFEVALDQQMRIKKGAISVTVSSSNLREPVRLTIPIEVSYEHASSQDEITIRVH